MFINDNTLIKGTRIYKKNHEKMKYIGGNDGAVYSDDCYKNAKSWQKQLLDLWRYEIINDIPVIT